MEGDKVRCIESVTDCIKYILFIVIGDPTALIALLVGINEIVKVAGVSRPKLKRLYFK